ncbi:putative transferase CAF17 -like protein, mitochondrial [Trichinella spiralis]|uniref:Putative transferase CAF17-like protein, mitochondrial n=1 Tax=Trichinella spiralis TaxID=6334 RepID=A0A0V1B5I2_TRISP|nr:putative transferase CAF17 -like protein, mitochondrial [Trichinella spiralis]
MLISFASSWLKRTQAWIIGSRASFSNSPVWCLLNNRKILKVTGPDRMALLQLVLSNDVLLLHEHRSLYSLMLNKQGRIMYDVLLFEDEDGKSTLVECDADVHADVIAFILKYRMRKTVDVVADNSRSVYVYYLPNQAHIREPSIRLPDGTLIAKDPRSEYLGFRIITESSLISTISAGCVTLKEYIDYRYSLALGEGSKDFIPGTCFPHETNARQFKGMNFSKGCYIGQELTARIEYTGVVRKRFMPLLFHVDQLQKLCTVQYNSQVICERNRTNYFPSDDIFAIEQQLTANNAVFLIKAMQIFISAFIETATGNSVLTLCEPSFLLCTFVVHAVLIAESSSIDEKILRIYYTDQHQQLCLQIGELTIGRRMDENLFSYTRTFEFFASIFSPRLQLLLPFATILPYLYDRVHASMAAAKLQRTKSELFVMIADIDLVNDVEAPVLHRAFHASSAEIANLVELPE